MYGAVYVQQHAEVCHISSTTDLTPPTSPRYRGRGFADQAHVLRKASYSTETGPRTRSLFDKNGYIRRKRGFIPGRICPTHSQVLRTSRRRQELTIPYVHMIVRDFDHDARAYSYAAKSAEHAPRFFSCDPTSAKPASVPETDHVLPSIFVYDTALQEEQNNPPPPGGGGGGGHNFGKARENMAHTILCKVFKSKEAGKMRIYLTLSQKLSPTTKENYHTFQHFCLPPPPLPSCA